MGVNIRPFPIALHEAKGENAGIADAERGEPQAASAFHRGIFSVWTRDRLIQGHQRELGMTDRRERSESREICESRIVWERPELRRLEAGSAEAGGVSVLSDGATFS